MNNGNPNNLHIVNVPNARTTNPMALKILKFTEYRRMVSLMNQIKYNIFKESEICKSIVPRCRRWRIKANTANKN
jgi:hypothetical protein